MLRRELLVVVSLLAAGPLAGQEPSHPHASPYAELQDRQIKALSEAEVESLLSGEGMGFALPAELNGYPGPRHVLELADSLRLSEDQRAEAEQIMSRMSEQAQRLGARIVDEERALDAAFAAGTITGESLQLATGRIGDLYAELRAAHLSAHLIMKGLLSTHQIHLYQTLRGYGGTDGHEDGH